eukprot:2984056-Amphidinium_carterae.2
MLILLLWKEGLQDAAEAEAAVRPQRTRGLEAQANILIPCSPRDLPFFLFHLCSQVILPLQGRVSSPHNDQVNVKHAQCSHPAIASRASVSTKLLAALACWSQRVCISDVHSGGGAPASIATCAILLGANMKHNSLASPYSLRIHTFRKGVDSSHPILRGSKFQAL